MNIEQDNSNPPTLFHETEHTIEVSLESSNQKNVKSKPIKVREPATHRKNLGFFEFLKTKCSCCCASYDLSDDEIR